MTKTILSLFDYSGNWSKPYRENGYNVIQVDIKLGLNIYDLDYKNLPDIYGILAAVPCTDFSVSGARHWAAKDKDGRTAESIKLAKYTLKIINYLEPVFWVIENPVGRISKLVPGLGKPWYFQPCDYGDPYTKKTGLFGRFTPPLPLFIGKPRRIVEPISNPRKTDNGYKSGGALIDEYYRSAWQIKPIEGSKMPKLSPSKNRAELRSITPLGFAYAFYEANK